MNKILASDMDDYIDNIEELDDGLENLEELDDHLEDDNNTNETVYTENKEIIDNIISNFEDITGYRINQLYEFVDPLDFDNESDFEDYITENGSWDWTYDSDHAGDELRDYLLNEGYEESKIEEIINEVYDIIIDDYILEEQNIDLYWNR